MNERIYLSPPCMLGRERQLLLDAFDSNWIAPLGPHVNAFENEFAQRVGMKHAAAVSSGTAALHLALLLTGVGPGDRVVTSSFTFAATANAIKYVSAEPVFVDSEWTSWNMDPNLLRECLQKCRSENRLPKAVLTVDILGQCCDYASIQAICSEFELPLIEDAAEALGATYQNRPAGSFGDIACFSFNGNKIITTSGGGMLVTNSADRAAKARHLATQARDPAPHYEHSEVGYNYRLSNLLAAIGRGQLEVLDEHVRRRRGIFEVYQNALSERPGLTLMPEIPGGKSTRWLTVLLIDPQKFGEDRESVRQRLEAANIESRPAWKPMHCQPIFQGCEFVGGNVSLQIFEQGLCLPSGSSLSWEQQKRVIEVLLGSTR
ncbi:MAG: aminotransferase class I/II-fold pyridoxal phosphate-dependent enzyme [Planctomycetaceae bacterium]|nr:aminotransferase class I/II-fold pyridoxal phosphate-dependent enzyme [Planctomycetaceae bacterium]